MQLITCILAQYYCSLNSSLSYRYHTNVIRSRKRKILGVFIPVIMHTSSSKKVFKQWINYPDEDSEFRRHGFHLCSVAPVSAHINPCCQTSPHYENTFQITPRHITSKRNIKESLPLCLYRAFFVVSSDYLLTTEATQSHQLCNLLFVNQFANLWYCGSR